MISKAGCFAAALILAALAAVPAEASLITVSLGNPSSALVNGAATNSLAVQAAQTGSSGVFFGACGTDTALNNNCLASWTFNYVVPAGETVTGGSLTLGLVDIDSVAAGFQVNNYSIVGGDNLTVGLNAAAELVLSANSQYDVFTLPLTSFAVFNSGSATVNFALQPPGKGVLPAGTVSNGAFLIFSRLELTSAPTNGNPNPVPDPASSVMLLATSLGILATARAKQRAR